MADETIHGKRRPFSASAVLDAVAGDLAQIKSSDRLTYSDVGAVLGKSEDQAAKYCEGTADMGLVSFARGKREWNGRFTGGLDRLCEESRPRSLSDQVAESQVLRAALALSVALEDGEIDAEEVRRNRGTIEAARDALDGLLAKLRPAA